MLFFGCYHIYGVIYMPLGRIAVIMPAVYDELDCEFLSGIHKAAMDTGYDTLVFTGVSAENDKDYTEGENNIYELFFFR